MTRTAKISYSRVDFRKPYTCTISENGKPVARIPCVSEAGARRTAAKWGAVVAE